MKLGFIGTGATGSTVARHLLETGHEVAVYNRTKAKANPLVTKGAVWADTPKAVTKQSNILFTVVGYPKDAEKIYYGESGTLPADVSGRVLVDLATSTLALAEKIVKTAKEKGVDVLDAPVSDGDLGAKNGALTIMVGGEEPVYNQVFPLFKESGTTFILHGSVEKGQRTRMANQIIIADMMIGMTEMLVYTQKGGLALEKVTETLSGESAASWSLSNYSPCILKEDYTPGSSIKHFIKDLKIALEGTEKMDLVLPATIRALKLYEELIDKGPEDDGTQALVRPWWPEGKIPEEKL